MLTSAFERARESGKPNWIEMSAAVLKNRLLDLTQGTFDEKNYGALQFLELLRSLPELLDIDTSSHPPRVRLLTPSHLEARDGPAPLIPERLRDDLWRAIYDYSSGGGYVWGDGVATWLSEPSLNDLVLPTVRPEELDQWRIDFASETGDPAVMTWAKEGRRTSALPMELRPTWNSLLREKAVERLEAWFEQHGLKFPDPLLPRNSSRGDSEEIERLRRYLQRCISLMTADELIAMWIPSSVAARLSR